MSVCVCVFLQCVVFVVFFFIVESVCVLFCGLACCVVDLLCCVVES